MGRPEEPLQRDGSPVREFAFWLRDLRNRSGLTYQQVARTTNYATSTIQAAAAGRALPTLKVAAAFVTACGGDQIAWRRYWMQVKRSLDADSPSEINGHVAPPWAAQAYLSTAEAHVAGGRPAAGSNGSGRGTLNGQREGNGRVVPASTVMRSLPAVPDSQVGWYVESFHALLRLDGSQPEAIERRVVVTIEDGLRELATSISVPRVPGDASAAHRLDAELLCGGSLELRDQPYESYFRHVIVLASPLRAGQRHEYQLRLRIPHGQPMTPHYVYVPFCRSDCFQLVVRFPQDRNPQAIETLDGVPPAVIYERSPAGPILAPDRFGEIRIDFQDLKVGRGYGLRWQE